jgi:hypothetical protein
VTAILRTHSFDNYCTSLAHTLALTLENSDIQLKKLAARKYTGGLTRVSNRTMTNSDSTPFRKQDYERMEGKATKKSEEHALVRPVALFLDGMSRAVILPFGPSLVYRLIYGGSVKLDLNCAKVAYPLAIVVAAYLVGRCLGKSIAARLPMSTYKLPQFTARLAGATIALHVFTLGAGLSSVWSLVIIRFLSATLVGILCFITKPTSAREEEPTFFEEDRLESGDLLKTESKRMKRRDSYADIGSGTEKIYMTAFAVSILSGGLLYRHATRDATFQALTGSSTFTWSSLFLVTVSMTAEIILRCVFALFNSSEATSEQCTTSRSNNTLTPRREFLNSPAATYLTAEQFLLDKDDLEVFSTPMRSRDQSRDRLATSDSEFFDCNSVFSDMEGFDDEPHKGEVGGTSGNISLYVDRRCVYADWSPSYVPSGDSPGRIPPNFLAFCGGKTKKAQEMWKATQKWRYERNVWRIHTMPNRWFPKIKNAYPHFVHGFSKAGYPIIYEQPGKMNLKELFRNGCEIADMVRHYTFFLEYISNCICTREDVRGAMGPTRLPHDSSSWGIIVVMDASGAGLSHLSGDVLRYLKQAGDINSSHYPLSMKRVFLVNSPFWLAGAWTSIKGILPDSVQVDILSTSKYSAALREYIDDDQIPPEYGGVSPYSLGEHPFELELACLVEEANKGEDEPLDEGPAPTFESEPAYSFYQNTNSWNTEMEGVSIEVDAEAMNSGTGTSQLSREPLSNANSNPLRRRASSLAPSEYDEDDDSYDGKKRDSIAGGGDIFVIVSAMHVLWSAIQGVIETAIPLWMLTPPELGGLGYAPSRSGVSMFCSVMVLLWVMRTKFSRVISQSPSKAPMRSFRIGSGSEAVLLFLLAVVPKSVA